MTENGHSVRDALRAIREGSPGTEPEFLEPKKWEPGTGPTALGWYFGVSHQRAEQIMNPKKAEARGAVTRALASGWLERPDECEGCGRQSKTIAHHEDYDYPLDVQFYCQFCHSGMHSKPQLVRLTVKELPHLKEQRQLERIRRLDNRVAEIRRCLDCHKPRKITINHLRVAHYTNMPTKRCQSCQMKRATILGPSRLGMGRRNDACGHLEKRHYGRGMCQPCWGRWNYARKKAAKPPAPSAGPGGR